MGSSLGPLGPNPPSACITPEPSHALWAWLSAVVGALSSTFLAWANGFWSAAADLGFIPPTVAVLGVLALESGLDTDISLSGLY